MPTVLIDNFALQGAYSALKLNQVGKIQEQCLGHILECIVIYDSVIVPEDVLERNDASKYVSKLFDDIICGRQIRETPDIHHHLVDDSIIRSFHSFLRSKKPFSDIDLPAAYGIDRVGVPLGWKAPGHRGRYEPEYSFQERHCYYTYYCVRLAAALCTNYAPNPTRINLLDSPTFMTNKSFPNFQKDIISYFIDTRGKYLANLTDIFGSLKKGVQMPLVYNYLSARSNNNSELIRNTLKLRNSVEAQAFRALCTNLEESVRITANLDDVDVCMKEIKQLGERWSKSLQAERNTKKWSLNWIIGTDFKTPWFNQKAIDRKPCFVFLHNLLRSV